MKTDVIDQVEALDAEAYFKLMANLMKNNPPAAADAPILARMSRLGIAPGQDFDMTKLDPAVAAALQKLPDLAARVIELTDILYQSDREYNSTEVALKFARSKSEWSLWAKSSAAG